MRSCFTGLIDAVDQQTQPDHALLYDYHRQRIVDLFATQPDLPLDQDSLAGFLHGVLAARTYLVPAGSIEQQSMFAVFGGTVQLARTLPIVPGPVTAGRGFITRLARTLPPDLAIDGNDGTGSTGDTDGTDAIGGTDPAGPADSDATTHLIEAFGIVDDVPITCATLGGFCLGVLYATPWLPEHTGALSLLTAACHHALRLR